VLQGPLCREHANAKLMCFRGFSQDFQRALRMNCSRRVPAPRNICAGDSFCAGESALLLAEVGLLSLQPLARMCVPTEVAAEAQATLGHYGSKILMR
jgi:hypothetical protein